MSVAELGAELSDRVGRHIPHDGYLLLGLDPVTGAGCFLAHERAYSARARRQLAVEEPAGPWDDGRPVLAVGAGRYSAELHRTMAAEGFGAALRIAARHGGVLWGELVLLRGRGFSPTEEARAGGLSGALGVAVRRFVADRPLTAGRGGPAPAVVLVGADDTVRATPGTRAALGVLVPDARTDEDLFGPLWNLVHAARRGTGPALTRAPTAHGWMAVHAQPLDGGPPGEVAVTVGPASGGVLLPAVVAWYGITPREGAVLRLVLDGLPARGIARRLELSQYTVNDHLRALYRKTGTHGRDELAAALGG
ncbi:helix-turn-helix transcriptional regulator [Longispora sp. K20-0274]|uniref:helix-turn-helix transcriptional regulator n=1 Tax=Longispora sp. K20-0274 TaxID=3088255 RepID=UPI00399BB995